MREKEWDNPALNNHSIKVCISWAEQPVNDLLLPDADLLYWTGEKQTFYSLRNQSENSLVCLCEVCMWRSEEMQTINK